MFQDIVRMYSRQPTFATLSNYEILISLEQDNGTILNESLQRAQANALRCVAGHVECDLSPIPGIADTWTGPNNA